MTVPTPAPGAPSTTGLPAHVASSLAYLAGPLSGVLVLLAERADRGVRFHAWQSVIALGVLWALGLVLYGLAFASIFVSANALFVLLSLAAFVWLAALAVCIVCAVRAYKGQPCKLPIAGEYAERKAGSAFIL